MKNALYSVLVALALVSCAKEEEVVTPPTPNKYTLTITADTGGSVSSPGGTYNEGSKITVTATPDGMYLFKEWSDGSTTNPREITVTSNLTLKASFIKKTYPLAVTVEGEGIVQEEVIIQGSTTETEYNAGTTVRLTATPNEGWVFAGWSGDVESDELVIEVSIEKGMAVSALFKRDSFELNITIEGEGTVKEEVIVQPSQYDYETVVRLTAIPEGNWSVFKGWSGDVTSEEETIEVTISNVININVLFEDVDVKVKTKSQTLQLSQVGLSPEELRQTLGIVAGPFHYSDSNESFMLFPGQAPWVAGRPDLGIQSRTDDNRVPTFSFVKNNGFWEYHKSFPEAGFWGPRSFEAVGNTFFVADGNEIGTGGDWKGDLFMGEILGGGDIKWTRVNSEEEMGYYHGLGVGDLNGDGLVDAGVAPANSRIQLFYQNTDGSFSMNSEQLIVVTRNPDGVEVPPFALQFSDLDYDGKAEIITSGYGQGSGQNPSNNKDLNEIRVYKKNSSLDSYELKFVDQVPISVFSLGIGATSIKVSDLNKDGLKDVIIAREAFYNLEFVNTFEVWIATSPLEFEFAFSSPIYSEQTLMFREFLMFDVNNDGFDDIILRPHAFGSLYRIVPNTFNINDSKGVKLNHLIWLNKGDGTFSHYDTETLEVRDILTYNLYPYMENDILHFMGIYPINSEIGEIITTDIEVRIKD